MSWWDASGFSSFATQVVKNAQKKIDKVLDIEGQAKALETATATTPTLTSKPKTEEKDFWNSWLPTGNLKPDDASDSESASETRESSSETRESSSETRESSSGTRESSSETRESSSETRESSSETREYASETRESSSETRESAASPTRESAASPNQPNLQKQSSSQTQQKPDVTAETGLARWNEREEKKNVSKEEPSGWNIGWTLGSSEGEDKEKPSPSSEGEAKAKPKSSSEGKAKENPIPSSLSDFEFNVPGSQTKPDSPSPATDVQTVLSVSCERDRGEKTQNQETENEKEFEEKRSPKTSLSCSSSVSGAAEIQVQTQPEHYMSRSLAASSLSELPGSFKIGDGKPHSQRDDVIVDTLVPREDDLEIEVDQVIESNVSDLVLCSDSRKHHFDVDLLHNVGEDAHTGNKKETPEFGSEFLNVNLKDERTPKEQESLSSNLSGNFVDSSTVIVETSLSNQESQNSLTDFSFGSLHDSSSMDIVHSSHVPDEAASNACASAEQSDEPVPNSDGHQLQIHVEPSVSMSTSESSILTLSSPGQDELIDNPYGLQDNPYVVKSVDSDYLNISGPEICSIQSLSSIQSTISLQSFSSDQSVSSARDIGDSAVEPRPDDKESLEQTDNDQSNGSSDASRLDSSMDTCTSVDTVMEKVGQGDSGSESEKHEGSLPCVSLNGSYVKCMLEDAMEEKPDDSGSDHHSIGEKSESSKFESEVDKSASGHESSDEIETTTSSDIEIISTPNGDTFVKPFDLSPLRIALQKTASHSGHLHRRTDSQSSGSTYSKGGESDQMSPGRDSLERQEESGDEERGLSDLYALREEDPDSPYHPQKLLKCVKSKQGQDIIKKLAEKEEILQHRENKLVQLSKDNNDLLEANSILRNQLQQMEELRETEMADLNTLTDEFTKRLSEAEHKTQTVLREKENIKQQLETVQAELSKRAGDVNLQSLLIEKDEIITELRHEGEKLSKQQLQSNNIIKKLRVKEKESDTLITTQKTKIEAQTKEVEHLRLVCDSKEDLEKKQSEAINQLNLAIQKQMKDVEVLKTELEEAHDKSRSLQVTLDGSYKEIAELNKWNAAQDSKAQEAALSASLQVREELEMSIEKETQRFKYEKEALIVQIEDLRMMMARMERDHNRREDMLRQEISDLHQQLQEDEARNQELTQGVSAATKPLLRQIENLQSTFSVQSRSMEKVEKNLTERLGDVQNKLALSVEKERTANENVMTLTTRVTALDTQCTRLRQEKAQLLAQVEMDKAKIEKLEDAKHSELAQVEAVRNQMSKEISELKKQKVFLESQLEMEKTKVESERRKVTVIEEQVRILEKERPLSRGTPSPVSVSRQESVSSFTDHPAWFTTVPQEDLLERGLMLGSPNGNKVNLYESLRQTGAASILENLQSQLKQREGEIVQLQSEITDLERTRESMARELVSLTNENEDLREEIKEVPMLQGQMQDINQRYHALLQMYGEKVEQAEELKLDLADVKEMYKAQIDQLLAK